MKDLESLSPQDDSLSVEVTTRCNSACSHCFVRARGTGHSSLALDLVKDLLQEGYQVGYRRLHVTGGEPLLWDGLLHVLDHAFELGYQAVFLNTNGTLLTADICRKLAWYKDLAVSVSLQGLRGLHDSIRGKGSFDRTRQGIDHALSARLSVYIFTTVGRSLLQDLTRYAEEISVAFPGIERLTFIQLIRVQQDVFDLSREVLTPEDFLAFVRRIALLVLYGVRIGVLNNPLAAVAARVLSMTWLPPSPALYQPGSVLITADLRITLAHSTTHHFGIYEPGILAKTLGSHEYCLAVSEDRTTCGKCVYSRLCRAEGMVRPSEWYRDMFPQVPYCVRVLSKASSYGHPVF